MAEGPLRAREGGCAPERGLDRLHLGDVVRRRPRPVGVDVVHLRPGKARRLQAGGDRSGDGGHHHFGLGRFGRLEATATGVALENGGFNQEIRVRNEGSKKVVVAKVLEAGLVSVGGE